MRTSIRVVLLASALLCQCEKQAQTRAPDARAPAPTTSAPTPTAPNPELTATKQTTAPSSPPPSTPPPGTAAVQATGKRSSRAAAVVAHCKSPPPVACTTNAECSIFDIASWDGVCASTLKVGINAAQRAAYLAGSPCFVPGPAAPPPCVVHWVRAEDGPEQPPPGTVIAARCIKGPTGGTCLSQYFARSE